MIGVESGNLFMIFTSFFFPSTSWVPPSPHQTLNMASKGMLGILLPWGPLPFFLIFSSGLTLSRRLPQHCTQTLSIIIQQCICFREPSRQSKHRNVFGSWTNKFSPHLLKKQHSCWPVILAKILSGGSCISPGGELVYLGKVPNFPPTPSQGPIALTPTR